MAGKIGNPAIFAAMAAVVAPGAAYAGTPATAAGFTQANVVEPAFIAQLTSLRFGQLLRPTSAGTLTLDVNGVATATGGVIGNYAIPQMGTGRGAGSFLISGNKNRFVSVTLPPSATLTRSAGVTMTVNNFTANVNNQGRIKLDRFGEAILFVGARLNVGANQTVGLYSGTYNVTVAYN